MRNILTIPLLVINAEQLPISGNFDIPGDLAVYGYAAKSHYRLVISNYSLYTFTVLALMAIIWSGCVLAYCWGFGGVVANMSQFAEIDFASKCVEGVSAGKDLGMSAMLYGLGNTATAEVKEGIREKTIFLGALRSDVMFPSVEGRVVLSTTDEVDELTERRKYL